MTTTYIDGHAPTENDYLDAVKYADDVMNKEACMSDPDMYEWVPAAISRYPCPGLDCEPGVCRFKKQTCKSLSELPFYECKRQKVSCDTDPSGTCEVCEYGIKSGRRIIGPFVDGGAPPGCYPGDQKYAEDVAHPTPSLTPATSTSGFCDHDDQCRSGFTCAGIEPDEVYEKAGQACTQTSDCGGGRSVCSEQGYCVADTYYEGQCVATCISSEECAHISEDSMCGADPRDATLFGRCYTPPPENDTSKDRCKPPKRQYTPYTVNMFDEDGKEVARPVPCSFDEQCSISPGAGGRCGMDPGQPDTYGFCYDASLPPYLEWRDEVQTWTGLPPNKNVCTETLPYPRKWCEMPWSRASDHPENPSEPLDQSVKMAWKTRARPPFWYNQNDGTCHVTRSYCTKNLKNGGMSAGYGRGRDYWLGSMCSGDTKKEIVGAYDCCTKMGDSFASFFLGRTMTTDLRELVEGDAEGFGSRWNAYFSRVCEGEGCPDAHTPGVTLDDHKRNLEERGVREAINLVSDPRLKQNIVPIAHHVLSPSVNIHGYEWEWAPEATRLYGLRGRSRGLLTTEVKREMPEVVHTDDHGYDHLVLGKEEEALFRVYYALSEPPSGLH